MKIESQIEGYEHEGLSKLMRGRASVRNDANTPSEELGKFKGIPNTGESPRLGSNIGWWSETPRSSQFRGTLPQLAAVRGTVGPDYELTTGGGEK